ncbi:MAG: hybrid sensor histidine kinase/response regulator [Ignavibacteriales bacterium]|nr:hybrid sensor histidine kinase/response regulator [Ignavibacteriales bacterium]
MKTPPKILIVDDEDAFRMLLAATLEDEGFEITTAPDGERAIEFINDHTFDIALLDVRMPGIDGMEVLQKIRQLSPTTDCIMLTGFQDIDLAVNAIKKGAKDFLGKTLSVDELLLRINNVLRAHQAEAHITEVQQDYTSKLMHDLMSPLHSLQSAIDFLEQGLGGPVTDLQKKVLLEINSMLGSMDALLNDMIDLSLFESGRIDIQKIPSNIDELIPSVCARFKPQISVKNIKLNINIENNIPTITIDPARIEQVTNNLLDNAVKYTRENGEITVSVSTVIEEVNNKPTEFVEVSVSDTGQGIGHAELPFVFDKFKEVLTGKSSEKKTTGLGLAICRSIIEAHHGSMSATSELGKGSTFRFRLPAEAT